MIAFGKGQLVEGLAADATCTHCGEAFDEQGGVVIPTLGRADRPAPFHDECFTRMLVGGVNHQRKLCDCCGGTEGPDPPSLSKREAARVAAMHHKLQCERMK